MRKTLVLTAFTFLVGLLAGFLDGRPSHIAIPTARAMINGGGGTGGGTGGCNGRGAQPMCANCTGANADKCTHGLCVGAYDCKDGPAPNGVSPNWCYTINSGCASGGTTVGKVQ
jgi:hypothetical protein